MTQPIHPLAGTADEVRAFEAASAPVVLPEPAPTLSRSMFATQREFADAMEQYRKDWAEIEAEHALPAGVCAPVLYVSKGQLENHRDPDGPDCSVAGRYLPARITPAGNFTTPLFEGPAASFQARVQPWLLECFGEMIAGDREERNHRFLEESLELVQSLGCTASEAHQLVDYVFGRPVGEPAQEAGGVMVTLAALCLANGLDMHTAGEVELARIWTKVEAIRAKQAAKPKHSPLPMHLPELQAGTRDAGITWPKARDVGRFDDMSPGDSIRVGLDSDNDVYVSVCSGGGVGSVEFCNPGGGGGGKSSRTRLALLALMVAMEADNADDPGRDWWKRRDTKAAKE